MVLILNKITLPSCKTDDLWANMDMFPSKIVKGNNKATTLNQWHIIHQWPTYLEPNVLCSKES